MIGFDTCAIIDFLKGNENLKEIASKQRPFVYFSDFSYLELLKGTDNSTLIKELFVHGQSFALSHEVLELAADISKQQRKLGKDIPLPDCIIAASFLHHKIDTIVTKDKHFTQIPQIKAISY